MQFCVIPSGEPGSEIAQLGSDLIALGPFGLVTADSFVPIDLAAGTQYWLVMTPYDATTEMSWGDGGTVSVPAARTGNGTTWSMIDFTAQFQIDGTPTTATPEPATLPLTPVGGLGLLIIARKAARHRRVK